MNALLFQRLSDFLSSSIFLSRPRPDFCTATFDAIRSTTQPRSRSDSSSHVLRPRAVGDGSGDSVLSARYHFLKQRERLRHRRLSGVQVRRPSLSRRDRYVEND
jgi:hypothetical protein